MQEVWAFGLEEPDRHLSAFRQRFITLNLNENTEPLAGVLELMNLFSRGSESVHEQYRLWVLPDLSQTASETEYALLSPSCPKVKRPHPGWTASPVRGPFFTKIKTCGVMMSGGRQVVPSSTTSRDFT